MCTGADGGRAYLEHRAGAKPPRANDRSAKRNLYHVEIASLSPVHDRSKEGCYSLSRHPKSQVKGETRNDSTTAVSKGFLHRKRLSMNIDSTAALNLEYRTRARSNHPPRFLDHRIQPRGKFQGVGQANRQQVQDPFGPMHQSLKQQTVGLLPSSSVCCPGG